MRITAREDKYENKNAAGLLLNPFGKSFLLGMEMIEAILKSEPDIGAAPDGE